MSIGAATASAAKPPPPPPPPPKVNDPSAASARGVAPSSPSVDPATTNAPVTQPAAPAARPPASPEVVAGSRAGAVQAEKMAKANMLPAPAPAQSTASPADPNNTTGAPTGQPVGAPVKPGDFSTNYRGERSTLTPDKAFNQGFQPKGDNLSLKDHVTTNTAKSQFVSSSSDPKIAKEFATNGGARKNGNIYAINGTGQIDAARATNNAGYTVDQKERVYKGGVKPSQVQGRYPVTNGQVGAFEANPNYKAPASTTARTVGGGVVGIAAYEATKAVLPAVQQGVNQLEQAGYKQTAEAIRETGRVAGDFVEGAAPVAQAVSKGLQALGLGERAAAWTGILADTAARVNPVTGPAYNLYSVGLGVANAAYGWGARRGWF